MAAKNYFQKIDEFKEKIHFNDKLGLDERDNVIMTLIQTNPDISQEEIAKKIKLSQPSVGARLRKLRDKGILHAVNGVNFKVVDLFLAKIDINTTDTTGLVNEFKDCPFFLNALVTSGKYNVCLLFTATDLKRLEGIVNCHLRGNPKVKEIEMNIVISAAKDFVLPLNVDYDNKNQLNCKQDCYECEGELCFDK
ncbi:Lrp/AsnC family transcriptional regulator [Candidatus Woesearchaeota archaeon]|jgi:Lrp/AsnC family transcriptional regulator, leucine-responsive regulatory protein|nr:Lrp/AsnC family transcriptional regulator [Candidatus Woesearchaeota archaeon]